MNIIFIGHKSSGKSTIAKIVAKNLKKYFADADKILLNRHSEFDSLATMYQSVGDEKFREYESQCIAGLGLDNFVLATGGGVVLSSKNMQLLKMQGKIVYLCADEQTLIARNSKRLQHGILSSVGTNEKEYEKRHNLYQSYTDIIIKTAGKNVKQIVAEVLENLNGEQ